MESHELTKEYLSKAIPFLHWRYDTPYSIVATIDHETDVMIFDDHDNNPHKEVINFIYADTRDSITFTRDNTELVTLAFKAFDKIRYKESDKLSFANIEKIKNDLISQMRYKFPNCSYTILITYWDDFTFRVECRYGYSEDGNNHNIKHEKCIIHRYTWYDNKITYKTDIVGTNNQIVDLPYCDKFTSEIYTIDDFHKDVLELSKIPNSKSALGITNKLIDIANKLKSK